MRARLRGESHGHSVEERFRCWWVERLNPQLQETCLQQRCRAIVADPEQHDDWVRLDPPGHEGENVTCRPIEPLRILRNHHDRCWFGDGGEEVQRCERDEERIGRSTC